MQFETLTTFTERKMVVFLQKSHVDLSPSYPVIYPRHFNKSFVEVTIAIKLCKHSVRRLTHPEINDTVRHWTTAWLCLFLVFRSI